MRKKRKIKLARILPDLLLVYKYFRNDILPQSKLIATSLGALILGVFFRLLEPWPLKFVLDEVFTDTTPTTATSITLPSSWSINTIVLAVSIAVVLIAVSRAAVDYFSRVGFFKVGNYVVIRVRDRVYRHLQSLPMSFHDHSKHGDLITRITRDVSLLRDVTATAILPLVGSMMVLVGMGIVMTLLNWRLAAISLIILPLYWVTTVRLGRRIKETARKQRKREGAMATIASRAMTCIREMKALGVEEKFATEFGSKNNRSQTEDLKASRLSLRLSRTVDIMLAIATAIVLWQGTKFVLGNSMSPGDLVVFLVYLKRSFKPAQEFAKYTARIAKATAAGERVIGLLENQPEDLRTSAPELEVREGQIEFRDISFGYDRNQLVFKNFDLTLEPGKTVAIMGPSGGGKSTLLNMLLQFYSPQSGQVLIDGQDLQECSLLSGRQVIGSLLQDPLLIPGTIFDNLRLGAERKLSKSELLSAARLAEVDEFVSELPQQYETVIGERSSTLSRGQRQRIAIARFALSDRKILILDEPTTGLDEQNLSILTEVLFDLAYDRTAIVVTHNPAIAKRADELIFIGDGQVLHRGTYASLVRSGLAGFSNQIPGSSPLTKVSQ